MQQAIDAYLDQVMAHAALSRSDATRVRAELSEHLHEMLDEAGGNRLNFEETIAMCASEFGDAKELGQSIRISKGRVRTFIKRRVKRTLIGVGVCVLILLGVRSALAEAFVVAGSGVAPILPTGSRCVVYKLASSFAAGDVIVFHPAEKPQISELAIVQSQDEQGNLVVKRNGHAPFTINRSAIVGRVFLNTR